MPAKLSSLLLLWTFWSTILVHGYKIDQSCEKEGIYDKVEAALELAFEMAHAGVDALQRGVGMDSPKEFKNDGTPNPRYFKLDLDPPRPTELEDLIKNIFAHDDIINDEMPPMDVQSPYKYRMSIGNLKLRKVHRVLSEIIKYIEGEGPKEEKHKDATIYCDGSRFEFTSSKMFVKDNGRYNPIEDRDGIRVGGPLDSLKQCSQSGYTLSGQFAIAVTWPSPQGKVNKKDKYPRVFPAAIQLCKASVENIKKGVFDENQNFGSETWLGKRQRRKFSEGKYGFRQVDRFNLLAVTLLHEMTHTLATGVLDDVKIPLHRFPLFGASRSPAYRWDRIKALAKRKPYVETQAVTGPDNNADSIAYFALGCYLLGRKENPLAIGDDGVMKTLDAPVTFPAPFPSKRLS